jgi:hypothetical protein
VPSFLKTVALLVISYASNGQNVSMRREATITTLTNLEEERVKCEHRECRVFDKLERRIYELYES